MVYTLDGIRLHPLPYRRSSTSSANLSMRTCSFDRKFLGGRSLYESVSPSLIVSAKEKVVVFGSQRDSGSSSTDQLEAPDADTKDSKSKISESEDSLDEEQVDETSEITPAVLVEDIAVTEEESLPDAVISKESEAIRQISIPPPGAGQRIYEIDPLLGNHRLHLEYRYGHYKKMRESIDKYEGGLEVFSRGYEKFGFTRSETGITYREWAPGAKSASLIGDFNSWNPNADVMTRNEFGVWEIFLPNNADGSPPIPHGSRVKVKVPSRSMNKVISILKFVESYREEDGTHKRNVGG